MFDEILAYWLPGARQREAERAAQAESAAQAAQAQAVVDERRRACNHLSDMLTTTFGIDVWWLDPRIVNTATHPVAILSDSGILLWQADTAQWKLRRGIPKPRTWTYTQDVEMPQDLPPAVALDRLIVRINTFAQRLSAAASPPVCVECDGSGWGIIADCARCAGTGSRLRRRGRWW